MGLHRKPMHLNLGSVVYADIPYPDGSGSKIRPALVEGINTQTGAVAVRPIYTKQARGSVLIRANAENGLDHDSYVQGLIVVSRARIRDVIGRDSTWAADERHDGSGQWRLRSAS